MKRTPLKRSGPISRKSNKPSAGAPTTKKVDDLWSLVVRERAIHECQMWNCGNRKCGGPMNAHHIFGRGMSVRWNFDNGICACWTHHLHYIHNGNHQAAAQEDIREIIGAELYEELRVLHHKEGKNSAAYRKEVYAELSAILADLRKEAA